MCYGDSNTWGRVPKAGRYPRSVRWTGVLQNLLGNEYDIISEGVGGRTFVVVDPEKPHITGITHLKSILHTHEPIDIVTIMLGTNDVKDKYGLSAEDISKHLDETLSLVKGEGIKNIIVICPPNIVTAEDGNIHSSFVNGSKIFKVLPELFKEVSEKHNCCFINAEDHITSSKIDGFHFDPEGHQKLAEVLKSEVLNMNI